MDYPISLTLSNGKLYTLFAPDGEPSGPRLLLPDGAMTALNASGGCVEALSADDQAALQAAVPVSA